MKAQPIAHRARRIFDGHVMHEDAALLIDGGQVTSIVPRSAIPSHFADHRPVADLITPGFVDLQVNGGGGVLFNNEPSIEGIRTICAAHARFGTTSLLPTLITDAPAIRDKALAAGRQALAHSVPGYLGLHLEGPHLAIARKGAHPSEHIRAMDKADLATLLEAYGSFGKGLITIAPETVTPEQVGALSEAGWLVSLGHTDCKAATARAYFAAGAGMATHLFNAMSQLGSREPGLVGATLTSNEVHCGLIADCIHVDVTTMTIALRAKQGNGKILFVTDAMPPTGTEETEFILGERTIYRRDGRLTLADGTLAGADIDMLSTIHRAMDRLSLPLTEAIKMASLYPARAIGAPTKGHLQPGADADFLELANDLSLNATHIAGRCVFDSNSEEE